MGDAVDFEAFCLGQNAALIRMLTLYCGDAEVARDLAQEALARTWVHWQKVRRMDRPDLWVRRVALNLGKSHFRRLRVAREAQRRQAYSDESMTAVADSVDRLYMREALAHLTERQRESVLLRFLEDLTVEQTAELMGCSAGTVKKLTARALEALRQRVNEDFEVASDA
jgi:RNA polymerase sigma-70 factor (sigma-E family)